MKSGAIKLIIHNDFHCWILSVVYREIISTNIKNNNILIYYELNESKHIFTRCVTINILFDSSKYMYIFYVYWWSCEIIDFKWIANSNLEMNCSKLYQIFLNESNIPKLYQIFHIWLLRVIIGLVEH